jgi:3-hydroxyisobutyrate dehydrogenase-like beta-hydroxyacid dehydrogenase
MAKIAFCGIGRMGKPMAARLLDAGHDVTVWNRTEEKARELEASGAEVALSPRDSAEGAELLITMLTDRPALEEVLFGPKGLLEGTSSGAMLVEMSTIGPRGVQAIRERLPEETAMADAPVLGSVPQAEAGHLEVFVGGSKEDFRRCRSVLQALGNPRHVGGLSAGAALKIVINSTLGSVMVAVGEALALGDALGVDRAILLDVIRGSYLGGVIESKEGAIVGGDWSPRFTLSLAAKDLRLVNEEAERGGVTLRAAAANRHVYEEARDADYAELDYSAVIKYLTEHRR